MDDMGFNGNENINNNINQTNEFNSNTENLKEAKEEQEETVDYGFILVDNNSTTNAELLDQSNPEQAKNQYRNDEKYQKNYSEQYYNVKYDSMNIQENGKKAGKKRKGWLKTIAIAAAGSIIGGALVGAFIILALPKIQPSFKDYISDKSSTLTSDRETSKSTDSSSDAYKKIDYSEETSTIVTKVAKEVGPSVVGIMVTPGQTQRNFYGLFSIDESSPSQGSGIIIREDGYIVTNFHVIEDAYDSTGKFIKNSKIEVYLAGDTETPYEAEVVGKDSKTDLAVLKINKTGLPAVTFADSDKAQVGELAIAIGNPGGLEYMGSVTVGVISGLNRTVKTEDGKSLTYIQTDAAINPGNSGGALVNANGEVVGINTVKIVAEGFEGIGFAIPSNTVKEITNDLIEYKYVKGRPLLGIVAESDYTSEVAKYYGWPEGVYVADVTTFSGAYMAGIKPNDIITKFDGKEIKSFDELKAAIEKHKPGDVVKVEVYRNGKTLTFDVTLSEDKG